MSLDFDSARLPNPHLRPEHEAWRTQLRRFIDTEIIPHAENWDEAKKLAEAARAAGADEDKVDQIVKQATKESANKKRYEAFKKALAVNPFMPEVREAVERMAPDVEGRDI